MTSRRLVVLVALSLGPGCETRSEFDAHVSSAARRVEGDAATASRCTADLRALVEEAPAAAHAALAVQDGSPSSIEVLSSAAWPAGRLAERAREILSRRERSFEASRRLIAAAAPHGPAALEQVLAAVELSERTRLQLCQARDRAAATVYGHPARRGAASAGP